MRPTRNFLCLFFIRHCDIWVNPFDHASVHSSSWTVFAIFLALRERPLEWSVPMASLSTGKREVDLGFPVRGFCGDSFT